MEKSAVHLILVCAFSMYLKVFVATSTDDVNTLTSTEMKEIVATIPEAERDSFIRSNIELGYRIQQLQEQWKNKTAARLAVQIFNYFVNNHKTIRNKKHILNTFMATDVICYPEPIGCIDPDDSGIRPVWCLKPIWMERGEHRQLTWLEFVGMVKHRPMPEKYEFVRDNYLRGYELAQKGPEEMKNLDPENELALAIFQVVIQMEMRDTEKDVKRLLTMLPICFPLPIGCIDSDDAGLRPI